MQRTFVAAGYGTSMIFKINAKGRVCQAPPRCPSFKNRDVRIVAQIMRARGFAFYEVTRA